MDKTPSKNREKLQISPSKNRRRKGDGNGFIYWRTITKNGKDYQQAYYHWKENGQKKTRYISKKLLGDIQEAEAAKRPVKEILLFLGISITPSNNSPSNLLGDIQLSPSKSDISPSNNSPSNLLGDIPSSPSKSDISPSKMRRHKEEGSGNIHWRIITKKDKDYPQAYYHFEFWTQGDRLIKSSKYIPKQLIHRVEQLEQEKAPVKEILQVLGVEL
ncbi:hypothetical protein Cylst_6583 (plasmid) [Cylindrospermum stagnale PCC 7417]|uniref:Uncharacterized protein n=1 Tax=Cylindrospermum stagnale PCC 7417 TaxID=56107 RepID=K9X8C2_9NOST|nr:hypothetical protein [Cylindrospermum stagnale]AFZ28354.1 hypothetical protein Cylst_6583 [Cylindrospermum stagnale PCC 7417]